MGLLFLLMNQLLPLPEQHILIPRLLNMLPLPLSLLLPQLLLLFPLSLLLPLLLLVTAMLDLST